jgi:hypothetical protein
MLGSCLARQDEALMLMSARSARPEAWIPGALPGMPPAWNLPAHSALFDRILHWNEATAMLTTILIIVLILALIGALPNWGYSRGWG